MVGLGAPKKRLEKDKQATGRVVSEVVIYYSWSLSLNIPFCNKKTTKGTELWTMYHFFDDFPSHRKHQWTRITSMLTSSASLFAIEKSSTGNKETLYSACEKRFSHGENRSFQTHKVSVKSSSSRRSSEACTKANPSVRTAWYEKKWCPPSEFNCCNFCPDVPYVKRESLYNGYII